MNRRDDPDSFDEEQQHEVNPFSNKGNVPDSTSHIPLSFGQKHDATVDIPLNAMGDSKDRAKEIASWEADLRRKEKDIKRREDAVSRGIILCLVFNVLAVTIALISGEGASIFFLAIIYALMGCQLSYPLWYRPLYRGMNCILAFASFAAIPPPIIFAGKSFTGILVAIDLFSKFYPFNEGSTVSWVPCGRKL